MESHYDPNEARDEGGKWTSGGAGHPSEEGKGKQPIPGVSVVHGDKVNPRLAEVELELAPPEVKDWLSRFPLELRTSMGSIGSDEEAVRLLGYRSQARGAYDSDSHTAFVAYTGHGGMPGRDFMKTLWHEIGHHLGFSELGEEVARVIGFKGKPTSEQFGPAFEKWLDSKMPFHDPGEHPKPSKSRRKKRDIEASSPFVLTRKRKPGSVSPAERRQAFQMDADRRSLERLGVGPAAKIGWRARRAVVAAYGPRVRLSTLREVLRHQLVQARPLIAAGMVAGHVAGKRRAVLSAKKDGDATLALAFPQAYDAALKMLKKRLGMTKSELDDLRDTYEAEAIRVLEGVSHAIEKRLELAFYKATEAGAHVREGKRLMGEAFDAAGITPQNSFTLESVFRTQTQMAYAAGRWNMSQHPAVQEILWGWKWVSVGDDRVRPEHQGMEGVTAPKDDKLWDKWWPPGGWACRCTTIALYDEEPIHHPPKTIEVDGKEYEVKPDKGFGYNPGKAFPEKLSLELWSYDALILAGKWEESKHKRMGKGKASGKYKPGEFVPQGKEGAAKPKGKPKAEPADEGKGAPAPQMWDYQPTAVIRWMGKEGWTLKQARKVFDRMGVAISDATLTAQLYAGKKGTRGDPAALTDEQADTLRKHRDAKDEDEVTPPEPPKPIEKPPEPKQPEKPPEPPPPEPETPPEPKPEETGPTNFVKDRRGNKIAIKPGTMFYDSKHKEAFVIADVVPAGPNSQGLIRVVDSTGGLVGAFTGPDATDHLQKEFDRFNEWEAVDENRPPPHITFSGEATDFSRKIWRLSYGPQTEETMKRVGQAFHEEAMKDEEVRQAYNDLQSARRGLAGYNTNSAQRAYEKAIAKKYAQLLAQVRDVGTKGSAAKCRIGEHVRVTKASDPKLVRMLQEQQEGLPTDWMNAAVMETSRASRSKFEAERNSFPKPTMHIATRGRGHFVAHRDRHDERSGPEICAESHRDDDTGTHELVHWCEEYHPILNRLASVFRARRVKDSRKPKGRELSPIYPHSSDPKVREEEGFKDDFTEHYMGKVYRGRGADAGEILSMGVEGLLHGKYHLASKDEDYLHFITGVLASV